MRIARTMFLLTVLAAAVWAAGCSSEDPAGPMEDLVRITPGEAEDYATTALIMVNDMVTDIPEVAVGSFTTAKSFEAAGEPDWDPEAMAWVYDLEQEFSEGDPATSWGETRIHLWIQFRNAEGPLPTALGATVLEYRAVHGMTLHSESAEGVADLAYDLATTMLVTYVEGGYTVAGAGESTVEADFTDGQRTESMRLDMSWHADLVLADGSCPAGTADVTVGEYRLDAVYDGTDLAAWTLTGPDYQASGTEVLDCGPVGMPISLW